MYPRPPSEHHSARLWTPQRLLLFPLGHSKKGYVSLADCVHKNKTWYILPAYATRGGLFPWAVNWSR